MLTSIRGNSAAFGYSVMITSGYGILNGELGSPSLGQTLLFALGATLAFIVIEMLSARGLQRERGEPSDIVALGSALNVLSVGSGIGLTALAPILFAPTLAWPTASFAASFVYLLFTGAELAAAAELQAQVTGEERG